MYAQIFATIAPILICIGVGYFWARSKQPFDTDFISHIVSNIGAPCLVVTSLYSVDLDANLLVRIAGACFFITVTIGLIGVLGLRLVGFDRRIYLPSLMFGNIGNMGLSLSLFAFGEQGLAMAIAYFVSLSILMFTLGIAIVRGVSGKHLTGAVKNPIVVSIVVAVTLLVTEATVPAWMLQAMKLLGDTAIPLMLLTLGVSLSRLTIANLPRSVAVGSLRILLGFSIGLLTVNLFHLEGTARGVVLIQSSMPVAVFNYLFALRYHRAPDEVAGMVLFSTLLSFLILPLLLFFVF